MLITIKNHGVENIDSLKDIESILRDRLGDDLTVFIINMQEKK